MIDTNKQCRICFEDDFAVCERGGWLSPCMCKGGQKYVHAECLDRWRAESINGDAFTQCAVCKFKYWTETVYERTREEREKDEWNRFLLFLRDVLIFILVWQILVVIFMFIAKDIWGDKIPQRFDMVNSPNFAYYCAGQIAYFIGSAIWGVTSLLVSFCADVDPLYCFFCSPRRVRRENYFRHGHDPFIYPVFCDCGDCRGDCGGGHCGGGGNNPCAAVLVFVFFIIGVLFIVFFSFVMAIERMKRRDSLYTRREGVKRVKIKSLTDEQRAEEIRKWREGFNISTPPSSSCEPSSYDPPTPSTTKTQRDKVEISNQKKHLHTLPPLPLFMKDDVEDEKKQIQNQEKENVETTPPPSPIRAWK